MKKKKILLCAAVFTFLILLFGRKDATEILADDIGILEGSCSGTLS